MTASVERVFAAMAVSVDVAESDFLLLRARGFTSASSLYFRVPERADFEDILKSYILPNAGFDPQDGTGINVFARTAVGPAITWAEFKTSQDAAALRQLWQASKQLATKEIERMTEDTGVDGKSPMTTVVHADLIEKATRALKVPANLGERETPGRSTLSAVRANHGVGGKLAHLAWETFISADEERRQERLGLSKTSTQALVFKSDKLSVQPSNEEYLAMRVEDALSLTDCLRIRAVAFAVLNLVSLETYELYNAELLNAFRAQPALRMRGPTVAEARLVDRRIHEYLLKQVGSGRYASLEAGIREFSTSRRNHSYWQLLEETEETTPDRGLERNELLGSSQHGRVGKASEPAVKATGSAAEPAVTAGGRVCSVCGKTREDHEKRRFCARDPPTPDSSAGSKGKGKGSKGKGKVKKQEKQNKDHQYSAGDWKAWRAKKKEEGEK
jgi:hypothetical protein